MIKCPGCGSSLVFDPKSQLLRCPHCGRTENVENYTDSYPHYVEAEQSAYDPNLTNQVKTYDALVYKCPNCGAELIATDETASTFCSFCGDSVVLTPRLSRQKYPAYIIPFQKTREECEEAYKKKLRGAFFAPSRMKKETEIQKFRGIYMPYWTYDFETSRPLSLEGKESHRVGNYIHTDHYRLEKPVDARYEGASFDAASTFNDTLSEAIAPFDVGSAKEFTPAYLSGFYADVGDVDQNLYRKDAEHLAENYFRNQVMQDPVFRKYEISETTLRNQLAPNPCPEKMGLFPVWFLAARNRSNKRVSYAVVNGQTGKVAADLPVDFLKYILVSVAMAVPIFFFLNFFLTLTPVKALLVAAFLCVVALILANLQINRTYTREHNLDDRGLQSVRKKEEAEEREAPAEQTVKSSKKKQKSGKNAASTLATLIIIALGVVLLLKAPWIFDSGILLTFLAVGVFFVISLIFAAIRKVGNRGTNSRRKSAVSKAPMKEKMLVLIKPLLGIFIAGIVYLVSPAEDIYFYGAAALIMALIVWSFFDILRQHNKQTMRPLPQFDKRGGK